MNATGEVNVHKKSQKDIWKMVGNTKDVEKSKTFSTSKGAWLFKFK